MYATCLFCSGALGRNESIEHFPVGRRLAFDAAKGRLWVICPQCNRWNLTPLESRWEAIEEAERAYRDTKLRSATEQVGLARLKEGTELVRIGKPLLPEFAAWRYGKIFGVRHWKARTLAWGTMLPPVVNQVLHFASQMQTGAWDTYLPSSVSMSLSTIGIAAGTYAGVASFRRRIMVRMPGARWVSVRVAHAKKSLIVTNPADATWSLRLHHAQRRGGGRLWNSFAHGSLAGMDKGYLDLHDDDASRALRSILPLANDAGSSAKVVARAVDLVTGTTPLDHLLTGGKWPGQAFPMLAKGGNTLGYITPDLRLALEMSLHESDERRAMEGELHMLESRWREAEQIAAIADRLFLPADFEERLDTLRNPQ